MISPREIVGSIEFEATSIKGWLMPTLTTEARKTTIDESSTTPRMMIVLISFLWVPRAITSPTCVRKSAEYMLGTLTYASSNYPSRKASKRKQVNNLDVQLEPVERLTNVGN